MPDADSIAGRGASGPKRPGIWLLVAVVLALGAIAAAAAFEERETAFTLGVTPESEIASLPGQVEVCQEPIDVSAAFERVGFTLDASSMPTPRVAVEMRSFPDGRVLAEGRVPGGYPLGERPATAQVGRVEAGQDISVCIRTRGPGRVGLVGGPVQASRTSTAFAEGETRDGDLSLVFLRDRPRSTLSLVPAMIDRAALWRPGIVSPVLIGGLLVLLAVAVPLLLGRAVRRASADDAA